MYKFAPKSQNIWATFARNNCQEEFSKISQSGHTAKHFSDLSLMSGYFFLFTFYEFGQKFEFFNSKFINLYVCFIMCEIAKLQ